MTPWSDIIFLGVAYLAAFAATIAGFGSSTILLPLASLFMDIKTSIFVVACFHLFNNLFKLRFFFGRVDWRLCLSFGLPSILAAFAGAALVAWLPVWLITRLVAGFLLFYVIYALWKPAFEFKATSMTSIIGGTASGFLAGLIGLAGAIRSAFLISFHLPKETYIATGAMIAFVVDITRITTYFFKGVVQDNHALRLLPFLLLAAYVGVLSGKNFLNRIPRQRFRQIVLGAIFLIAIKLLAG